MIAIWAQQNHGLGQGFFLSIGRCIFWILTDTINFHLFIKYKFRCIQIYKYRVDQPAPETLLQENRMQQPKALTAGWSSSWSHSGVASCGPPRLCTAPTARWSVYVCNIIRYKDNQRYTKYDKVCGKPSFCSRSAKSCAAAKAAVPGNGLPPAASKLAVSVASVQHPSSIHYTWICCEMSSETTDSVISSNMMSYLSIMHNFKISRD